MAIPPHGCSELSHWVIIRCEGQSKEAEVARQIGVMGYQHWIPLEARSRRIHRKSKAYKVTYTPVIAGCLFAASELARDGNLASVRYLHSLERDSALQPLLIPDWQITAFRDMVDAHNLVIQRRVQRQAAGKVKARWKPMEAGTLAEILNEMFGAGQESEAA